MVTKFIGSVEQLVNCPSIALIGAEPETVLSFDKLQFFTKSYFGAENWKYCERLPRVNSLGKTIRDYDFSYVFNKKEQDSFLLNYIIMYNEYNRPIGYTYLQHDIKLKKYGIEEVRVSFEFRHGDTDLFQELVIDVYYGKHIDLTNKHLAHQNLKETYRNTYRALTSDELKLLKATNRGYSKNIIDAANRNSLIYRYSGKLSKEVYSLGSNHFKISKPILDKASYYDIMDVEGNDYFLIYTDTDNSLRIYNLDNPNIVNDLYEPNVIRNIVIARPYHLNIGSNFIVGSNQCFYLMRELVDPSISEATYPYSHSEDVFKLLWGINKRNLTDESLRVAKSPDGVYYCKDPIDKSLIPYTIKGKTLQTLDVELNEIIWEFTKANNKNATNLVLESNDLYSTTELTHQLIYAHKGLLLTAVVDNNVLVYPNLFNYDIPSEPTPGILRSSKIPIDLNEEDGTGFYYHHYHPEYDETGTAIPRDQIFLNTFNVITPSLFLLGIYNEEGKDKRDRITWEHLTYSDFDPSLEWPLYEKHDINERNYYPPNNTGEEDPIEALDPYMYYSPVDNYLATLCKFYLLETHAEYNSRELSYSPKLYPLIGSSGLKNFDKIVKYHDSSLINNFIPINVVNKGNIYGKVQSEDKQFYYIRHL